MIVAYACCGCAVACVPDDEPNWRRWVTAQKRQHRTVRWQAEADVTPCPHDSPPPAREQPVYRPMTDDEQSMALALSRCTFVPGSFAKRFARDLGQIADADEPCITEKQAALLRKQVVHYRRQIPGAVVALVQQETLTPAPPQEGGL